MFENKFYVPLTFCHLKFYKETKKKRYIKWEVKRPSLYEKEIQLNTTNMLLNFNGCNRHRFLSYRHMSVYSSHKKHSPYLYIYSYSLPILSIRLSWPIIFLEKIKIEIIFVANSFRFVSTLFIKWGLPLLSFISYLFSITEHGFLHLWFLS